MSRFEANLPENLELDTITDEKIKGRLNGHPISIAINRIAWKYPWTIYLEDYDSSFKHIARSKILEQIFSWLDDERKENLVILAGMCGKGTARRVLWGMEKYSLNSLIKRDYRETPISTIYNSLTHQRIRVNWRRNSNGDFVRDKILIHSKLENAIELFRDLEKLKLPDSGEAEGAFDEVVQGLKDRRATILARAMEE